MRDDSGLVDEEDDEGWEPEPPAEVAAEAAAAAEPGRKGFFSMFILTPS